MIPEAVDLNYWLAPRSLVWSGIVMGYFISAIYFSMDELAEAQTPFKYWGPTFTIGFFLLLTVHRGELMVLLVPPVPELIFDWSAELSAITGLGFIWAILIHHVGVTPPHTRLRRAFSDLRSRLF